MSNIQKSIIKLRKLPYLDKPYSSRAWGHPLHSLCSYQSKLKPSIAYFLAELFGNKNELVFEPFSGVGTIPFELAQKGVKTVSLDINPVAYYVTYAKLRKNRTEDIFNQLSELGDFIKNYNVSEKDLRYADKYIKRFYHKRTLKEILAAIKFFEGKNEKYAFLKACLLHILHGNRPYALSRISHNITPYSPRGKFIYKSLVESLRNKAERMLSVELNEEFKEGEVFQGNILDFNYPKKFDKIITSPPFVNSTRFLYNNRIRLWFNGFSYKEQMKQANDYIENKGMDVFDEIINKFSTLLKSGGYCILHLGVVNSLDMGKEISKYAKKHRMRTLALFYEDVNGKEKFGLRDQGATHKHQFLILKKN
jgi:tRNA1(Val) A37 N6-methylase TrmN6